MAHGYAGKLLFVNLSNNEIEKKALTEEMAGNFIGGYGIGARMLYDMMTPGADPLGPENVMGFVTGPLTASGALFGGRYIVVCKSPVTGVWNDANSGGYFGPELKKAGYDGVFISGAAEKPVYLWIHDGAVDIRDAEHLWGMDSVETHEKLVEETGEKKLRAALIGPAGENRSLIACVMNDKHRAAGRGGAGAVMGSKNLKAVAVRGTGKISIAHPDKLKTVNQSVVNAMKNGPTATLAQAFGMFGTGVGTAGSALSGDSPVKNWGGAGGVDFSEASAQKLDVPMIDGKYKTKKYACANCPLGCGADYEVKEGNWPMDKTQRPEYETFASFGCLCLNDSPEAIFKCNDLCNRYGLDTISAGATIAWAMECFENNVITVEETGGIELNWGNAAAMVEMTEAMGKCQGFGKILALGSRGAAEALGKGGQYLQTVNGIELPMHDPRFAPGFARTYRTDPTPARHVKGGMGLAQCMEEHNEAKYNTDNTGPADLMMTARNELMQASGVCMFSDFMAIETLVPDFLEAVTGRKLSTEEVQKTGLRIFNMRHAFSLREGLQLKDINMPDRSVGQPPLKGGPLDGVVLDPKTLHGNFCAEIKWDKDTLIPSKELLEALGGLTDVAEDLWKSQ